MTVPDEQQVTEQIEGVVSFLKDHDLVLAVAESCTGGLTSSLLAAISGCGQVLDRGYVVYTPEAKQDCLGVCSETIEQYGLTSAEVAQEMALGCLHNSCATVAISNTGLAEADSDMDGVVYFGWATRVAGVEVAVTDRVKFPGERNEVRAAAAHYGLLQLPLRLEQFWQETHLSD